MCIVLVGTSGAVVSLKEVLGILASFDHAHLTPKTMSTTTTPYPDGGERCVANISAAHVDTTMSARPFANTASPSLPKHALPRWRCECAIIVISESRRSGKIECLLLLFDDGDEAPKPLSYISPSSIPVPFSRLRGRRPRPPPVPQYQASYS